MAFYAPDGSPVPIDQFLLHLFTHKVNILDEYNGVQNGQAAFPLYNEINKRFGSFMIDKRDLIAQKTYFAYLNVPAEERPEAVGLDDDVGQLYLVDHFGPNNVYKNTFDLYSKEISYDTWTQGQRVDIEPANQFLLDVDAVLEVDEENDSGYDFLCNLTGWSNAQRTLQTYHTLYALFHGKFMPNPAHQMTFLDLISKDLSPQEQQQCNQIANMSYTDLKLHVVNSDALAQALLTYMRVVSNYIEHPIHPAILDRIHAYLPVDMYLVFVQQVNNAVGSLTIHNMHGIYDRVPEIANNIDMIYTDVYRKSSGRLKRWNPDDNYTFRFVLSEQDRNAFMNPAQRVGILTRLKVRSIIRNEPGLSKLLNHPIRNVNAFNYYTYRTLAFIHRHLHGEMVNMDELQLSEFALNQEEMFEGVEHRIVRVRTLCERIYGTLHAYSPLRSDLLTLEEYQAYILHMQQLHEQQQQQLQLQQQVQQQIQHHLDGDETDEEDDEDDEDDENDAPPQGIAYEIHNAFDAIDVDIYTTFLNNKIPGPIEEKPYVQAIPKFQIIEGGVQAHPKNLLYSMFVALWEKYNGDRPKDALREDIERIFFERIFHHETELQYPEMLLKTLGFVMKTNHLPVINLYLESFTNDCVHAYQGPNGMSCAHGVLERIVLSFFQAVNTLCCAQDCGVPELKEMCSVIRLTEFDSNIDLFNGFIQSWTAEQDAAEYAAATKELRKTFLINYMVQKYMSGFDDPALEQRFRNKITAKLNAYPFTEFNFRCSDPFDAITDPAGCAEAEGQGGQGRRRRRRNTRKLRKSRKSKRVRGSRKTRKTRKTRRGRGRRSNKHRSRKARNIRKTRRGRGRGGNKRRSRRRRKTRKARHPRVFKKRPVHTRKRRRYRKHARRTRKH